ncbi:hypothetical protein BH10BAC2_BH10BAC2_37480 [soil metagenome]
MFTSIVNSVRLDYMHQQKQGGWKILFIWDEIRYTSNCRYLFWQLTAANKL